MTKEEALVLQQQWAADGGLPCSHSLVSLMQTKGQYLTGDYACEHCGQVQEKDKTYSRGRRHVLNNGVREGKVRNPLYRLGLVSEREVL